MPLHASVVQHRQQAVIRVQFGYDKELINRFRQLPGARWSQTLQSWYLPDTEEYRRRFAIPVKEKDATLPVLHIALIREPQPMQAKASTAIKAIPATATIQPCNTGIIERVKEQLILKGYSQSKQRTYLNEIAPFLKLLCKVPAEKMQTADIKRYLV